MVEFNNNGSVAVGRPAARQRRRGSKIRVYIADEQVLLRRGLASMIRGQRDLELCGETSSCTTAVKEVCELRPDVVIMELSFGGGRGIELIESIKAIDPGIGVVVLSRLEEGLHALSALKAGAGAYVTKQSPPSKALDAIRKVRDGKMCVSEYVANRMFNRVASGQGTEAFSPASSLSPRELEIYKLIGAGRTSREIAELLQISFKTVETHRAHIKEKANLTSAFELTLSSMRWAGAAGCVAG